MVTVSDGTDSVRQQVLWTVTQVGVTLASLGLGWVAESTVGGVFEQLFADQWPGALEDASKRHAPEERGRWLVKLEDTLVKQTGLGQTADEGGRQSPPDAVTVSVTPPPYRHICLGTPGHVRGKP